MNDTYEETYENTEMTAEPEECEPQTLARSFVELKDSPSPEETGDEDVPAAPVKKSFDTVLREMQEDEKAIKADARKSIIIGMLLLVLGVGASFIGFLLAKPGGTYTVYTGAMVVGAIGAVKGLISFFTLHGRLKKYEMETWTKRLGHAPTNTDDEYVEFMNIIHTPGEKVKTILATVLIVVLLAAMGFAGYSMIKGEVPLFGSSQEDAVEQQLYDELVELNDKLTTLDAQITEYEDQLTQMQDEYEKSPSEELEVKYDEVYELYSAAIDEYNSTLEVFQEKYAYYEETYGFDD